MENNQALKFHLLVLLHDMFQQLQAGMGIHSGNQCQKSSSHIIEKIEAFQFKNKGKKPSKNEASNEAKSGYSRVQLPLVLCVAIIDISPDSQTHVVQSFVVNFVEHVVPEPTGADFVCYQADQGNRGHSRVPTKRGGKKSLSYTNHNQMQNQIQAQEAASSCNHRDNSRLLVG